MTGRGDAIDTLGDTFCRALEAGSVAGVLACYTSDATIWHNFDQLSLTPEESVAGLETLFTAFTARRYLDVRRRPTPDGFVQQHILQLERPDGVVIAWPGCIVFGLRDGKISRIEEYVDMAQLTAEIA